MKRFSLFLVIPILLALGPGGDAAAKQVASDYETVEEVAPGVYVFIAPEPKTGFVNANTTVIVGGDGVIVVDPGQFPSLAKRQIARIREWTDQPVRWVVNTHWHWDHNLANSVYRDVYPEVAIVSTPFTRESTEEYTPTFLDGIIGRGDRTIEVLETQLETGTKSDGTELTAEEMNFRRDLFDDFRATLPEFRKATVDLPDVTFERAMTIRLGDREVRLLAPGRGNTAGDVTVWVPDAGILVTGDLVVHPTPYATGAYPAEWVEILRELKDLQPAIVVPGHGPVQRNLEYVNLIIDSLESIVERVTRAIDEGLTLEAAQEQIDLSAIRERFAGDDPARQKSFDDYFAPSVVESAWREAKGEPIDESPF